MTDLLRVNPFPDEPPTFLRGTVYEYRFTTAEERRKTHQWWARELKGLYCPLMSLKAR